MVTAPRDLRITANIWPEVPMAGEPFTATIIIANRFDRAVEVTKVETVLPAELVPLRTRPQNQTPGGSMGSRLRQAFALIQFPSRVEYRAERATAVAQVAPAAPPAGAPPPTIVLQPGSSEVWNFQIKTRSWLLASPRKHKLDISIAYKLAGDTNEHFETLPIQFDARPPLNAVVVGALFGAFIGALAQELIKGENFKANWLKVVIRFVLAMVLGGVGVIFVSRRSPSQPLPISVEDFWGGFLAGFLVGYFGSGYFVTFLPEAQSAAPGGG